MSGIGRDGFTIVVRAGAPHGPGQPAWGRLMCDRCPDEPIRTWPSRTPPTLGELDRVADFHRLSEHTSQDPPAR